MQILGNFLKMKRPADFDEIVRRTKTIQLTDNTKKVTKLPDEFEPKDQNVDKIANLMP